MRISKSQLQQIIHEVLAATLVEQRKLPEPAGPSALKTSPPKPKPPLPVTPVEDQIKLPPSIDTELTIGGTHEIPVGERGAVKVGGSLRQGHGAYENVDDLLKDITFGGKGKYDLGKGIGAYGTVDYTIDPSADGLRKIQTALGGGITLNNMVDLGIVKPLGGDAQGRVGLNLGALTLAIQAGKGGARAGNIGASANLDMGELMRGMMRKAKKQGNLEEAIKQIIKEELTAVLNESPPLFSQPSAAERWGHDYQGPPAIDAYAGPDLRDLASDIGALPDSKMIKIEKVFNAQGDVLDREAAGANITAHTIRLLAAASGDSSLAGAAERGDPIDVTVDMDGKVIGAQVAKKLGGPGTA